MDSYIRNLNLLFDPWRREGLAIPDPTKVRFDYGLEAVTLKKQGDGNYPTDANIYADLPAITPTISGRGLFEAISNVPDGTSIMWQVRNGEAGPWLYFDGADWVAAGAGNWNTEAELNDNLVDLPIIEQYLQFRANLITTDQAQTPVLYGLTISYLSRVDPIEDLIYRTVVRSFKQLDLWTEVHRKLTVDQDYVDVGNLDGLGYEINGALSAFDLTVDPFKTDNILDSWNSGLKRAELTRVVSSGNTVEVRLNYSPDCLFSAGVDFEEIKRVPAIIVLGARVDKVYHGMQEAVKNKSSIIADLINYDQSEWVFDCMIAVPRQTDLTRIVGALKERFTGDPFFYSPNFNERYAVIWEAEPDYSQATSLTDLKEARFSFRLMWVPQYISNIETPLVIQFKPILTRRIA